MFFLLGQVRDVSCTSVQCSGTQPNESRHTTHHHHPEGTCALKQAESDALYIYPSAHSLSRESVPGSPALRAATSDNKCSQLIALFNGMARHRAQDRSCCCCCGTLIVRHGNLRNYYQHPFPGTLLARCMKSGSVIMVDDSSRRTRRVLACH